MNDDSRFNVLLVEDDPDHARLVRALLEEADVDAEVAYRLHHVSCFTEAMVAVETVQPDIILLDLGLPDSTGIATLRAMRGCTSAIPIVVLTGEEDANVGIEAMRLGAEDFVIKGGYCRYTLVRSIRFAFERKRAKNAEREQQHLEHAVEALRDVLGVVGHELRTPLAAMRLTAEFLLNDAAPFSPGQRSMLRSIHDEATGLAETINNLLEAARLNSGVTCWNWTAVPVAEITRDAAELVRHLIRTDKVALRVDLDDESMRMAGDPDAVRRILINLLSNAVKHTHEGSIEVRVREHRRVAARWIEFAVRDTGEGMSPEVASKLGQPFVLNSGVVGAEYVRGAGLGLSICKKIAAAHGGSITIHSRPGAGSTVTVHLRADLDEPVCEQAHTPPNMAVEIPA